MIIHKKRTLGKLSQAILDRKRELSKIDAKISETIKVTRESADYLLEEAKIKASDLITEAKKQLDIGNQLKSSNEQLCKELNEVGQRLVERENQAQKLEKSNDEKLDAIRQDEQKFEILMHQAEDYKNKTEEMFLIQLQLLEASFSQLKGIKELPQSLSLESAQRLNQASKLLEKVTSLVKEVDAEKSYLNSKEIDLEKQRVFLKDRTALLKRTEKEILKNG